MSWCRIRWGHQQQIWGGGGKGVFFISNRLTLSGAGAEYTEAITVTSVEVSLYSVGKGLFTRPGPDTEHVTGINGNLEKGTYSLLVKGLDKG